MRPWLGSAAALAILVVCSAHIGSPDAWYDGPAGPYHVLVHVQAPPVIPGIAVVNVKVREPDFDSVTAVVNKFDATGVAPPPDVAAPTSETPGWYRTRLWVMAAGSNGVTIAVHGPKGSGSALVPLTAVAGRRLDFNAPLATLLSAVAIFLALGMFTIVGAAVRESVLPPGVEPDAQRRRRARHAIARSAIVLALVIGGMGAWWRAADAGFTRQLFQPLAISARVDTAPARLTISIDDSAWARRNDVGWLRARGKVQLTGLIEDHGKLMHLFVVAEDGRSAFAHLHPVTADTVTFTTPLPPLPSGRYRAFADIVHESGFAQTLSATIAVQERASSLAGAVANADLDDSWALARRDTATNMATLEDGTTLHWLRGRERLAAGSEANLRFSVNPPLGDTAALEPYLGMNGHAVVVHNDGSVFIHLHPMGTISVAAQARLVHSAPVQAASDAMSAHEASRDALYFPYAFPQSGSYTVWVQVKRRGRVLTGSFAADVGSAVR